ncbi:MAG: CZB domain-containing protein [Gammaproteobacteria bacterium]|nr:CZB domain-containing protein [Gammaproteobacteria bacterium]
MDEGIQEIMTFKTGESLFGVPIQNVLSILGESDKMFCKAFRSKEALGIIEYRGIPVAVIDLAIAGNITSDSELKTGLIEVLNQREQDHIDWLDALEKSITDNEPFTLPKEAHNCEFGRWQKTVVTKDDDLREIINEFEEPHTNLHSIADRLLTMKNNGEDIEKCLEILAVERNTTLAKLTALFERAVNQLKSTIKPVFIYLTLDGNTPCAAIRVDEIADVESIAENAFVSMTEMALPQVNDMAYIEGFLKLGEKGECLLIDVDILTNHRSMDLEQTKSA